MKIPVLANEQVQEVELLAISQDPQLARSLKTLGISNQWHLELVVTGWKAMEMLDRGATPKLVLLDLPQNFADNLYLLQWLRRFRTDLHVLAVCAADDMETRTEAMRLGAEGLLMRPFSDQQLESAIRKYVGRYAGVEVFYERFTACDEESFRLSKNPEIRKLCAHAELLAKADVPVLILGEKGSGKEAVAEMIHRLSANPAAKLRKVNCALLAPERAEREIFAHASNGNGMLVAHDANAAHPQQRAILFLSETSALSDRVQALLASEIHLELSKRTPKDLSASIPRILASVSVNAEEAISGSKLREDLYYLLSAFIVRVPAVRERREEIPDLLRYSMMKISRRDGLPARVFPAEMLSACQQHCWPGNLDELDGFVRQYLITGDAALRPSGQSLFPAASGSNGGDYGRTLASGELSPREASTGVPNSLKSFVRGVKWQAEKSAIGAALEKTGWNRKAASRLLNVSYRTLLYKIEQHQIKAPKNSSEAELASGESEARFASTQGQRARG